MRICAHLLVVSNVGNGEYVRRQGAEPSTLAVESGIFRVVDGKEVERVDGDQDRPNISVDVTAVEAVSKVVQQGLLRQFW